MNLATLNVEGPEEAIEALKAALPVEPKSTVKKGQPRRFGGGTFPADGFQVEIADAANPGEAHERIAAFLAQCEALGITFALPGVTAELSIGFTVGDSRQFAAGYDFSVADLRALAGRGIALGLMAYPTSDEANDEHYSEDMSFRPLGAEDMPLLHEWLGRPHVSRWWGDAPALAEVEGDYLPLTRDESKTRGYVALLNGAPIGFIQCYVAMDSGDGWWEHEKDSGVRGLDQFLANEHQLGQGLGTRMIEAFVQRLFEDPAVTKVQIDPSPDNTRAIRSCEKAGFVSQGEVDTPDGAAVLMVRGR